MRDANDMLVVGKVNGLFGVKGWVKVFSDTQPRKNILGYSPWYLKVDGSWQAYKLESGKVHGKGIIAHLEKCPDRDVAALLVGAQIAIRRDQLPALEEGEYYWSDLQGLKVITLDGIELGVVTELMETGANDVLVVRETSNKGNEQERLIPFIPEQVVTKVDLEQGVMTVDWDPDF